MKIWTQADIGSIVSFPRKHGRQRDYFRVIGLPDCNGCMGEGEAGITVDFARGTATPMEGNTCLKCQGSGKMVDLETLSKEDAAVEQAKQDRSDRLNELCWHHYGAKEGLVRYGVLLKRRGDPMVAADQELAAAYANRPIVDEFSSTR